MQLNGVPFEYKVTETPKQGTIEVWQFINLTVDAHPMHPHLVKHLIVRPPDVQRRRVQGGAVRLHDLPAGHRARATRCRSSRT